MLQSRITNHNWHRVRIMGKARLQSQMQSQRSRHASDAAPARPHREIGSRICSRLRGRLQRKLGIVDSTRQGWNEVSPSEATKKRGGSSGTRHGETTQLAGEGGERDRAQRQRNKDKTPAHKPHNHRAYDADTGPESQRRARNFSGA